MDEETVNTGSLDRCTIMMLLAIAVFFKYMLCFPNTVHVVCVCVIKMIITKQHQIEGRWPLLSFPLLPVFRSAMIECTQTLSGAPWPAEGGTRQVGSKLSAVNY